MLHTFSYHQAINQSIDRLTSLFLVCLCLVILSLSYWFNASLQQSQLLVNETVLMNEPQVRDRTDKMPGGPRQFVWRLYAASPNAICQQAHCVQGRIPSLDSRLGHGLPRALFHEIRLPQRGRVATHQAKLQCCRARTRGCQDTPHASNWVHEQRFKMSA